MLLLLLVSMVSDFTAVFLFYVLDFVSLVNLSLSITSMQIRDYSCTSLYDYYYKTGLGSDSCVEFYEY